ncbi:MAG: methanol--corrinoid methyltransferase, partial [Clostridiales bacterium]|nr:methanol--corrinoid methyltransferase [Clostridiales bacterium]
MSLKHFNKLTIDNIDDFVYGVSPHTVTTKNGFTLGDGLIYPELNFTLPTMKIEQSTMPEVLAQYRSIIQDSFMRAVALESPGVVAEVELLPATTYHPNWGIDICKLVKDEMNELEVKHGLKSALRITPVDIREDNNNEHMWHGKYWDLLMETFEGCANAGADYLSIESIGGKDTHDDAILYCEIDKSLFSLGVLGVRDMHKLWTGITDIANRTGTISAGDTACGFANTAMVLADKKYVPRLLAAVIRVISAVRSLAAYEAGAVGPHKDCGYEGVFIKAITGTPISMEGKTSAC